MMTMKVITSHLIHCSHDSHAGSHDNGATASAPCPPAAVADPAAPWPPGQRGYGTVSVDGKLQRHAVISSVGHPTVCWHIVVLLRSDCQLLSYSEQAWQALTEASATLSVCRVPRSL